MPASGGLYDAYYALVCNIALEIDASLVIYFSSYGTINKLESPYTIVTFIVYISLVCTVIMICNCWGILDYLVNKI